MTERLNHPEGTLSLQTIAMPADTNWSGDVFGGWIVWVVIVPFILSKKQGVNSN